jgi:hypothetical protein
VQGVSPDEEVGKYAPRAGIFLLSSASNVLLESTPRGAPSGFIKVPIDYNTRLFAEGIKEGLRPRGGGE